MILAPSEMVKELQRRLPNANDESRILLWLNEEQEFIESLRDDWRFGLDADTEDAENEITTVDGTPDYNLPEDFQRFLAVRNETDGITLKPKSLTLLSDADTARSETGSPTHYILLGKIGTDDTTGNPVEMVKLWPEADDAYTIPYDYYKKLPTLAIDGGDTPSLIPMHSLLMLGAEMRGRIDSEEDEDLQLLGMLSGRYATMLETLIKYNTFEPDKDAGMKPHFSVRLDQFGGM